MNSFETVNSDQEGRRMVRMVKRDQAWAGPYLYWALHKAYADHRAAVDPVCRDIAHQRCVQVATSALIKGRARRLAR